MTTGRKYSADKFAAKFSHTATSGVVGALEEYEVKAEVILRVVSTFTSSGTLTIQGRIQGSSTWTDIGTLAAGGATDEFDIATFDFIRFNFTVAAGSTGDIIAAGFFKASSAATTGTSYTPRNPVTDLDYFEDFITPGGQSAMGPFCFQPAISGSGASANSATSVGGRPGVIRLQAGTAAATSYSGIYSGFTTNSNNASLLFESGIVHVYKFYRYINNVDHADGLFYTWDGFLDTLNTSNARNGVYLYRDSSASSNWQFVTADRGTRTTTDTGVTAAVGWNVFEIRVEDVAGTMTATLKIDDVLVATNTTNIPITANEGVGIAHRVRKFDSVTTLRYLDLDWVELMITLGARA